MDLMNYFEDHNGFGVLSTADSKGVVNAALYARPRIQNGRAIFLAAPTQTLQNLEQNPYAHYLFAQEGEGYEGIRLQLKLLNIDKDAKRAKSLRRRHKEADAHEVSILEFEIIETSPLVGK